MIFKDFAKRVLHRMGYVVTISKRDDGNPIEKAIPEISRYEREAIERTAPFTMTEEARQWAFMWL